MLPLNQRLKNAVRQVEQAYAVGYAFGVSDAGVSYMNVLVSDRDVPSDRSMYSLYATPKLKQQIGIDNVDPNELCKNGERITAELERPVALGTLYFATMQHAPFLRERNGKKRWYDTSYAVGDSKESALSLLSSAIRTNYANATSFAKGKQFLEDYREYLLFETSIDDVEAALDKLMEDDEE